MRMWASAQLSTYVFFLGLILFLTESMSLASWPRMTSISPALARRAPHAAPLKSPPSPPLLYANPWLLPAPFTTRESTVTATATPGPIIACRTCHDTITIWRASPHNATMCKSCCNISSTQRAGLAITTTEATVDNNTAMTATVMEQHP
ncbi:hypothetical protein EDB86DRAFT_2904575 [Lactarius hatsudake]|nr:hypothetical protein EDB86DRAFT_2904575 [Lactarius hatsudake]